MSRVGWARWVWKSWEVGVNAQGEKLYAEKGAMYPPKTKQQMIEMFEQLRGVVQ